MRIFPLLALLLLLGGCAAALPEHDPEPREVRELWVLSLGHSQSDEAEEQAHLADVERVLLPLAEARSVDVIAFTVGADGYTSPRVLSSVSFDTSDVDGDNPVLRTRLLRDRHAQLLDDLRRKGGEIPFSPVSDVFGGFAAARSFFDQYPREVPKTLIAIGDQLANRPAGCVLGSRDVSTSSSRTSLLQLCAPGRHDFGGARIMLVGAGFSLDDPIESAAAVGLELLLGEYFSAANGCVILYGSVVVAPGSDSCPPSR